MDDLAFGSGPGMSRSRRRRAVGFPVLLAAAAGFVAYMAIKVPVRNLALRPTLTRSQATLHWPVAAAGLAAVLLVDGLVVVACRRATGSGPSVRAATASLRGDPSSGLSGFPAPLRVQGVSRWVLPITALVSAGVLAAGFSMHFPLWEKVVLALIPWAPLSFYEGAWKYEHYGFFAVFLGLAVLQVGHLGEHGAQVVQLLMYHGDLTRSHGVFGQLDFETVHFVWDTLVWAGACVLVLRFRENMWLWVSWVFASVHEVEHVYLFCIYKLHQSFWAHGGISGILGKGGLIGSPLARPYLHFGYNLLVVAPMLVGLWDQARWVYDRRLAADLTAISTDRLIAATESGRRPGSDLACT